MRFYFPMILLLAFSISGCDRKVEPWNAPEAEPPRPERPVRVPGLEQAAPPDLPGFKRAAETPDAVAGEGIRGVLRLAAGTRVQSGDALFLIARSAGSGPPLAVKKLEPKSFPMEFELGPGDVMIPGTVFRGPIFLGARLDTDGDASTRSDDDASAVALSTLEPGATGVELVLTRGGLLRDPGASEPASAAPPEAASGGEIRGTLRFAGAIPAPGAVVFVIARNAEAGPPLAVKRLAPGPFPLAFSIGPGDVMMPGRSFSGSIRLSARLDADANAMTRGPDDASARWEETLEPGASGVDLVLRQER